MTYQANFFYDPPAPEPEPEHAPLCACGKCPTPIERFDPVIKIGFGDRQKLKAILGGKIITTGGFNG